MSACRWKVTRSATNRGTRCHGVRVTYHSHFREVEQTVVGEVRRALLRKQLVSYDSSLCSKSRGWQEVQRTSSMNDRSVRYMPKYGMHGGSQRCSASRMLRKRPSVETSVCSLSIVCLDCSVESVARRPHMFVRIGCNVAMNTFFECQREDRVRAMKKR